MANTLLTSTLVSRKVASVFKNNFTLAKSLTTKYAEDFKGAMKPGESINVPIPFLPTVNTSTVTFSPEGLYTPSVPVTCNIQAHWDFEISSKEKTLSYEQARERYLVPAGKALAGTVEISAANVMGKAAQHSIGTAGTPFTDLSFVRQAKKILDYAGADTSDRRMVIDTDQEQVLIAAGYTMFNPNADISEQYRSGSVSLIHGFKTSMSQLLPSFTAGTPGGTPVIGAANQTGSVLALAGLAANGTVKAGQHFVIDQTFAVEATVKQVRSFKRMFVVLQDATANGAGAINLTISPALTPTGNYKNVSNSPASGAAVSFVDPANSVGTRSYAFSPESFTLVSLPLSDVNDADTAESKTIQDTDTGVYVRTVSKYDINSDSFKWRTDMLFAISPIRPEWAVAIKS